MAKQKDPIIILLNRFGYNAVKLPRVGIEPMDIIGSDETNRWLGPLHSVWKSSVAEPSPGAPRPAAAFAGQKTDKLEVKFGLKVLANALAAFGATVPSLDFAYTKAKKVQFAFTDINSVGVAPFEAGNYLVSGTLNTDNPVVKHYFLDGEAEAFLITEVLKSKSITVVASDDKGTTVKIDFPGIKGVIGGNVDVQASDSTGSTITYSGTDPVTFAFIIDRIQYDGLKWSLSGEGTGEHQLGFAAAAAAAAGGTETTIGSAAPIILGTGCRVAI